MPEAKPRTAALISGAWRIENTILDGTPRLKLTQRGYLVDAGYFTSEESIRSALARNGGPALESFERGAPAA